jgi:hypothetical protein
MPAARPERSFRVPYGLDEHGRLVARQDAVRGRAYACPACGEALVLRAGPRVSRNFAHRPSPVCSGETALHRAAKLLVKQVADDALTGGPGIDLRIPCATCRAEFTIGVPLASFDASSVEVRLQSGRVVDVLLSKDGQPRLGVEVFVSHRVDGRKAGALDIAWIEVDADELVAHPRRWRARASKLRRERCPRCRAVESLRRQHLGHALAHAGLVCPPSYRASPARCHRCSELIPLFDWDGGTWTRGSPPEPRPPTLQRTPSQRGATWANTCPHCRALQGDYQVRTAILDYLNDLAASVERALGAEPHGPT